MWGLDSERSWKTFVNIKICQGTERITLISYLIATPSEVFSKSAPAIWPFISPWKYFSGAKMKGVSVVLWGPHQPVPRLQVLMVRCWVLDAISSFQTSSLPRRPVWPYNSVRGTCQRHPSWSCCGDEFPTSLLAFSARSSPLGSALSCSALLLSHVSPAVEQFARLLSSIN